MAYTTYTTDALVCGTYDRNTADRSYRLFTRELGMVWADARSVRLEKSKQRMALSDFALVRVSLVRGKGGWKIGSVVAAQNYYHAAVDQSARGSVVTLVRLLRRYVQGEEPQPELFDFVVESLQVAVNALTARSFYDQAVTARILALLGYVPYERLPASVRRVEPRVLEQQYSAEVAHTIMSLLKTAEAASHL